MKFKFLTLFLFCFSILAMAQENIIKNGEFNDGKKSWTVKKIDAAQLTTDYPADSLLSGPASCRLAITQGGSQASDIYLQQLFSLQEGKLYTISFMAMADIEHKVQVWFQETDVLQRVFWSSPELQMQNSPQHFGPFTFKCNVSAPIRMMFLVGGQNNVTVRLDSIVVIKEDRPGYVPIVDKFLKREHTFGETTLPYRLCMPDFYDATQKYPLVLALHGVGECGTDNQIHIDVHRLATSWADSANQKTYPCFVVAPQCPLNNRWVDSDWSTGSYRISNTPVSNEMLAVIDLIDSLIKEFSVDENRLYVTGLSMGGFGTWDIITRYPDKFAAAVPMSGGGDSTRALRISHLPIWAFHGQVDTTVPADGSRQMMTAFEHLGRQVVYTHCDHGDCTGKSETDVAAEIEAGATALYTEWKGANHVMWAQSFDYPLLFPWVFAQNKENNGQAVLVNHNAKTTPAQFEIKQNYPNPFNPQTTIEYVLPNASNIKIEIYDLLGRRVKLLYEGYAAAGRHQKSFDASGLPSGKYIYQVTAGDYSACDVMTLQK